LALAKPPISNRVVRQDGRRISREYDAADPCAVTIDDHEDGLTSSVTIRLSASAPVGTSTSKVTSSSSPIAAFVLISTGDVDVVLDFSPSSITSGESRIVVPATLMSISMSPDVLGT